MTVQCNSHSTVCKGVDFTENGLCTMMRGHFCNFYSDSSAKKLNSQICKQITVGKEFASICNWSKAICFFGNWSKSICFGNWSACNWSINESTCNWSKSIDLVFTNNWAKSIDLVFFLLIIDLNRSTYSVYS